MTSHKCEHNLTFMIKNGVR